MRPMQPISTGEDGLPRFEANTIVKRLLEFARLHGLGQQELASENHSQEDWEQFAQLIGYSLRGFDELSYVSGAAKKIAERMAELGEDEQTARLRRAEMLLRELKSGLRHPISRLFELDRDSLS